MTLLARGIRVAAAFGVVAGALGIFGTSAGAAPAAPPGGSVGRNAVLAVHGGAGSLPRGSITPEREGRLPRRAGAGAAGRVRARHRRASGARRGRGRGAVLEDDPNFNAGKGAVFNTDGEHELDASIMNGADPRSGAVAGVHNTKNPISLARMVMERSSHVMTAGRGADVFALRNGVPYTRRRTTSSPSGAGTR